MDARTVERLKAEAVAEFLAAGDGIVIDTLPPEHFEARHIPGAVNGCVYEMVFLDTVVELVPDKATPLVLYGAGPRSLDSTMAADKLARAGYANLAIFPGGLEAWRAAGHPLEGTAVDQEEEPHPRLSLESRSYSLLPAESIIRWTGRNNNGGHSGTLCFSSGTLDGGETIGATFTIDMTTIRNTDLKDDGLQPILEAHLHSDDFFFTSLFPEAIFTATAVKLVEDGEATRPNGMIQGNLALRGMTNEIAFPVHIRNLDGGKVAILGNLDFDRTQWGIIYGSSRFFQHLGYHVVYDFISIDFRLVLE